jgi:hypothetical protein
MPKKATFLAHLGVQLVLALGAFAANADDGGRDCKGLRVIGLTDDQRLVWWKACKPKKVREIGPVSGLGGSDAALVGIDFRVQDGNLYGVGNGGGVYTLDLDSAEASFVSQLSVALVGSSFGVDFNPVADRLRIVSDTAQPEAQNLRHNVNVPTGGTTTDAGLTYTAPPAAPVPAAGISGAAYTNNDATVMSGPNTATTLFDLDASLNQLVIQSPPNNGILAATGGLGVDPGSAVGFDVYSRLDKDGQTRSNHGFASLVVDGTAGFFSIDLLTGRARSLGALGDTVVDIALPLDQ